MLDVLTPQQGSPSSPYSGGFGKQRSLYLPVKTVLMRACGEDQAESPPSDPRQGTFSYRELHEFQEYSGLGFLSDRSTDESRKVKKLEERIKGLQQIKEGYFRNLCSLQDQNEELLNRTQEQENLIEQLKKELISRNQCLSLIQAYRNSEEESQEDRATPTHDIFMRSKTHHIQSSLAGTEVGTGAAASTNRKFKFRRSSLEVGGEGISSVQGDFTDIQRDFEPMESPLHIRSHSLFSRASPESQAPPSLAKFASLQNPTNSVYDQSFPLNVQYAFQQNILDSIEGLKAGHTRIISILQDHTALFQRQEQGSLLLKQNNQIIQKKLQGVQSAYQQLVKENLQKKNQIDSLLTVCEMADHPRGAGLSASELPSLFKRLLADNRYAWTEESPSLVFKGNSSNYKSSKPTPLKLQDLDSSYLTLSFGDTSALKFANHLQSEELTDSRRQIERKCLKVPSPFEAIRIIEKGGNELSSVRDENNPSPQLGTTSHLITEEADNNELGQTIKEEETALWSEMKQLKHLVHTLLIKNPTKKEEENDSPGLKLFQRNFYSQKKDNISPRSQEDCLSRSVIHSHSVYKGKVYPVLTASACTSEIKTPRNDEDYYSGDKEDEDLTEWKLMEVKAIIGLKDVGWCVFFLSRYPLLL